MSVIDHTHDALASSWVSGADAHPDFPVQNLPLGIFDPGDGDCRIGTAIGDQILDARAIAAMLPAEVRLAMAEPVLNAVFALPAKDRRSLRHALFALLCDNAHSGVLERHLYPSEHCRLHLPARIGDYTDFYVGIHHANNIGRQFRPDNPLLPNYKHVPIGYHGRASSVRVSGTPVIRPLGQRKAPDLDAPIFAPTQRLDYELELGVWIGEENALGSPVPIGKAAERVAGLCLLNDWSARDFQAWEYQPLGPFLAKNFMSSVSPWVITAEALAPFRIAQPSRPIGDPQPLDYLWDDADQAEGAFAINLETQIASQTMREKGMPPHRLGRGPATSMYWTIAQMIAHHASGGCNLMPGDLLGTGTISTPDQTGLGSLMELSQGGKTPISLPDGEQRSFLQDGDELILSARAEREGRRSIGFGECRGVVRAAVPC